MRRTRASRNKSQGAEDNEESRLKTVWQWKGDEGQWEPYSPSACAVLDSAVSSGQTSVALTLGGGVDYDVDLKKMVQINPVTKYKRNIRSQTVKPESSNEVSASSASNETAAPVKEEDKEGEEEEKPAAKRKRGQSNRQTETEKKPKEEIKSEEVVRTVVMKGKAPVDPECKAKLGKAHVYCEGNDVYDVMLNQTNLQFNNNKYYLIQLLEDDSAKVYSVWMRWGRVGKVGQNSLTPCGGDLLKAKNFFTKKFLDKTKNEWEQRASFDKVAGKYDMVFVDYSTNEKEEEKEEVSTVAKKVSKLDVKVKSLLELICDLKAMEECVLEMKFDTRKAPLGKLKSDQIRAGYTALKTIEECLKKKGSNRELLEACNLFYTRIPHDFGLKTPPIIRTEEELKKKIALLEALSDIQIAVKMVQSSRGGDENPIDRQYSSLQCQLQPLDSSSHEFKLIEQYLQSTHAPTHQDYTMTVLDIFSVDREGESKNFLSKLHNRTLLWHGSRLSNWVGILSQGLRVAPPEAPVTGYMFGKGIYFADMSSKSANYCFANQHNHVGLLLLCEVALGDCHELLDADYAADILPAGKHSTKGLGQTGPDPKNSVTHNGVTVPMGPGVKTRVRNNSGYSLLYNEFVVYNPAQTRMRYLLRIKFNYSSLW
ncbi:poly [ADP-ribose] polymerase 2 [Solea senegalensis]|uniref:Poly [ADP-ribose] polymerase n=1 Tax=Solea senegalensis TaxID=28829 RepID=A0AAV6T7I7_SOLSE|nr:poly [ADP-ribose] polymerase 2 [Solea senegalensis]KAG7525359.1 poly [ADP-ribose] polymerase 2 [Solea senegalensis]